jgi:hypothetical protein
MISFFFKFLYLHINSVNRSVVIEKFILMEASSQRGTVTLNSEQGRSFGCMETRFESRRPIRKMHVALSTLYYAKYSHV